MGGVSDDEDFVHDAGRQRQVEILEEESSEDQQKSKGLSKDRQSCAGAPMIFAATPLLATLKDRTGETTVMV